MGLAVTLVALPALAADGDIVLRGMGSFHVGGRIAEVSGKEVRTIVRVPGGPPSKLDPNGQFQVEQMYVQYFLPKNRKGKLPLLMWHGGGLTGATYESTPDGREGWLNMFIRYGWDTYLSDAVERGRSGFASPDVWSGEPIFLNYRTPTSASASATGEGSWNADPAKRKVLPGSQFPVDAYDNYMKQTCRAGSRPTTPCSPATSRWSTGCARACCWCTARAASSASRPPKRGPTRSRRSSRSNRRARASSPRRRKLKDTPVLMVFGDYVDQHPRWAAYKKIDTEYANAVKAAGGTVDWINLPDIGIKGNSHMLMQDKNNAEIAEVIQKWLVGKGLVD